MGNCATCVNPLNTKTKEYPNRYPSLRGYVKEQVVWQDFELREKDGARYVTGKTLL